MQTHSPEESAAWAPIMQDAAPEPAAPDAPATLAHRILDAGSRALGLCGHGKPMNWSVRVADWFFVDCGCCWFWRGATVGAAFAFVASGLIAAAVYALQH